MGQVNICLKHAWSNICGVHASIILHFLPYFYPSQSSMRFNVSVQTKTDTKTVIFITKNLIKLYLLAFNHTLIKRQNKNVQEKINKSGNLTWKMSDGYGTNFISTSYCYSATIRIDLKRFIVRLFLHSNQLIYINGFPRALFINIQSQQKKNAFRFIRERLNVLFQTKLTTKIHLVLIVSGYKNISEKEWEIDSKAHYKHSNVSLHRGRVGIIGKSIKVLRRRVHLNVL